MSTRLKQWRSSIQPVIFVLLLLLARGTAEFTEPTFNIKFNASETSIEFTLENEDFEILNVSCKAINIVYSGSKPNTCENLEPCTSYLATLVIRPLDENSQGVTDQTLDASTIYATPEMKLEDVIPDQFSMVIKWNTINPSCMSKIKVGITSTDKEFIIDVAKDKDSTEIEGLNPCQTYDIQITTVDDKEEVIGEPIQTQSTTLTAEPEDITEIKFIHTEDNEVKVTWEYPKSKTCIRYYFLKWTTVECIEEMSLQSKGSLPNLEENSSDENGAPDNDGECRWYTKNMTDTNTKEFTIQNLDGCENYGLVFYINEIPSPKSNLSEFDSPTQIPSDIIDGNHDISSNSLTVKWETPKQNSKCVDFYIVQLIGPVQNAPELQVTYNVETNETLYKFENLEPCGKYLIKIQVKTSNGSMGAEVSSSISTAEDGPTKIRNPMVEARSKQLVMQWDPPDYAELCLQGYRIAVWYDTSSGSVFDKEINETNIIVDNLISCQVYTVQIIPFTNTKDGLPEQIEQTTTAIVASAPSPFQSTFTQSHSIMLSARVKADDYYTNKCQTLFARFSCATTKNVTYKNVIQYVEGRIGDLSFKALISPLSPNTEYVCTVSLYNTAGWSDNTRTIITTEKYYPEVPHHVDVIARSETSLRFKWQAPMFVNGNINAYVLYFRQVQSAFYIPPYCKSETIESSTIEWSRAEWEFPNLYPYTYYSIQIAARNDFGTGDFTLPIIDRTSPSISDVVTTFKVDSINGPDVTSSVFKAYTNVSWRIPCKTNGEIDIFELEFEGKRDGYDTVNFIRRVDPEYGNNGLMTFTESELQPEYKYEVNISVVNKDVPLKSEPHLLQFQAPAGIPDKILDISSAKVDAFEASNPTTSAVVRFPVALLSSDAGTILYAALLLSEKNCNSDPDLLIGALDSRNEWPNSASWMDSYSGEKCIRQYQTTPIRWQPMQPRDSAISEVKYTIGADSCSNESQRYCNGPLKADTEYQMVIRLFTMSSFSDAAVLEFKTDSVIKLALILIAITSCLMVAFIAGLLYLYIAKKITWHRESCHGIEDSSGDITSKNFAIFYNELSMRDKLQREFKELTVIATDFSFSASEENEYKNRYRDIFPYDKNRVILDIDADGNDYINASFINGYRRKKEYIATQGPKQETIVDFWRMVLQHKVRIIVMVTQFKEEDVIKCHHYYPWEWKDIKVEILKEDFFDLYDRREMLVTHAKQNIRQKIIHFYFKKWQDHGVPADPMSLITFVRNVKAEKCPSNSPIVVHCSAGVGRTGTFIALDIIMQRLKSESKLNIFESVKELRFQRMKMVQSIQQYTFLYTCAYQLVMQKRGKYKNHKKVSFKNDQDKALGTMQKVGVADVECGECNI